MGRREDLMVDYYNQETHFAELLNGWIFRGQSRLRAEQVRDGNIRYARKNEKRREVKIRALYRDILKKIEEIQVRVIVGTEIQTYVDYSMPVRAMDYDVGEYKRQIRQMQNRFRERHPGAVRLSGIGKAERLVPTVTLILYLGEEPWDGAHSLHSILDMERVPEDIRAYVADYPIHVLDVCHTEDERLMEFPKDIACMFLILKYQKEKQKLKELLESREEFQHIGADTYRTVWQYTNEASMLEKLNELENEKGEISMCQAIREIVEDSRQEGMQEGLQEGMQKGIQKGIQEGIQRGIRQGADRVNRLTLRLIVEKRYEDLARAASDQDYQNQLLESYGL